MYLKSWLSALSQDPKFIYTILSDVAKASAMIQEKVYGMEPKLSNDENSYWRQARAMKIN